MHDAPRTFKTLEAGRGIAAILVVAYHATILFGAGRSGRHFFTFGYSGVDFFFVLSGFIILYAHRADLGRPDRLGRYAWKRFTRIYPIYWVVAAPLIFAMHMVPSATDPYKQNLSFVLRCLLLLPTSLHALLGVTWSLSFEVLFYVVIGLALLNRTLAAAIGIVWIGLILFARHVSTSFAWTFITDRHILEFALGAACALAYPRLRHLALARLAWIGLLVYAGLAMANSYLWPAGGKAWDLYFAVCSALIILGATIGETGSSVKVPSLLTVLGSASYSIYLIHYPVLLVCQRVGRSLPTSILSVSAFVMAVAAGLVLHKFIEAPLQRFLNRGRTWLAAPKSPLAATLNSRRGPARLPHTREGVEVVELSN